MNLNRKIIEKNCEEFFALYDFTRDNIRRMCERKIIHTRSVAGNCDLLAKELGLEPYDCDLAWTAGELHDFARFGQAVVTKTFRDSERYNHAHLGASLLFTHGMIEDIIPDYDRMSVTDKKVLEKAVYHHSDYELPDTLDERERLFCEIVQDADRIDIFRNIVESGWDDMYGCSKEELLSSKISPDIATALLHSVMADYNKRKTPADCFLAHMALCFGLQSDAARKTAAGQGFIYKLLDITFKDPYDQNVFAGIRSNIEAFLKNDTKTRGL